MLNRKIKFFCNYYKSIKKKEVTTCYKTKKITSFDIDKTYFVHVGNNLIKRTWLYLHINKQNKFNVLFKKPLSKPIKKSKNR